MKRFVNYNVSQLFLRIDEKCIRNFDRKIRKEETACEAQVLTLCNVNAMAVTGCRQFVLQSCTNRSNLSWTVAEEMVRWRSRVSSSELWVSMKRWRICYLAIFIGF